MEDINEIKDLLSIPKQVVILSHRNPDGDALGSSLATKLFLEKSGHAVKVVLPSEYPNVFKYMPCVYDCIIFDDNHKIAINAIKEAEVIFCLDFNGLDRIDKIGKYVHESKAKKILIDHHLDPEPFADYIFSNTAASSTCEMVYKFINDLEQTRHIDKDIAECLFTGLITDTGSFKYNTNPYTYEVAALLKNKGADDYFLQDAIFNSYSQKQMKLLGHCLVNRMEIIPEHHAGIIALTKEDYANYEIGRGDTEGVVNYMLMIEGIKVAAFIREQPQIIKLSLRSKGDISVQELARNHFNGGGHKNASGGHAYAKLEDIVKRFKEVLPRYI